ncbi:hypothetical protein [Limnohabitans sp. INBF002]|uniref:hypothetical protein n=1 Tax=Limnohabitans sp. INBF002 TaxID=2986280 RepID=UPI00237708C5|nr:hypothetical protein [Limnohabitans sp. INBF002]BDU53479.1 hypothetical protein LINBF2_17140 [Limnohabitans sp. INBF002]
MRPLLSLLIRDLALFSICLVAWPAEATSEPQRIYRCGNAYTNQPDPALNCKPLAGGSVTVIEGTRVQGSQAASHSASTASTAVKVDAADQRQRDTQAQAVLQAELQKAQKQHAELLREWNNGEPERRADEFRQPQKYQDRLTQLRVALQRVEADVAGLQRELSRQPMASQTGGKP